MVPPHFIVPGVLVNLAWIAQMVAAILQRGLVARMDLTSSPHDASARVAGVLRWGRTIVRHVLATSPLLGLLLLQMLAKVVLGIDLVVALGAIIATVLLVVAACGALWLTLRVRRQGDRSQRAPVDHLPTRIGPRTEIDRSTESVPHATPAPSDEIPPPLAARRRCSASQSPSRTPTRIYSSTMG